MTTSQPQQHAHQQGAYTTGLGDPEAIGEDALQDPRGCSSARGELTLSQAMASVSSVLDEAGLNYELLSHTRTERAAGEANALGLPPTAVAKTLVVAAPGGHVRVVLPASERIDLRKLRDYVEGGKRIRLASEDELARAYPEFDLGAVPPFGGASHDRVLVDARVTGQHSVVLEGGSHEQSVRMETGDLLKVTEAEVVDICKEE